MRRLNRFPDGPNEVAGNCFEIDSLLSRAENDSSVLAASYFRR